MFSNELSVHQELYADLVGNVHRDFPLMLTESGEIWMLSRFFREASMVAAGLLARGIRRGDRVALHIGNGPELAVAYLACFQLGAIASPLNLRLKHFELEEILFRLQPKAYIGDAFRTHIVREYLDRNIPRSLRFSVNGGNADADSSWESLRDSNFPQALSKRDIHAVALLLTTSGTTGRPKFVAHSLSTILETALRLTALHHKGRFAFFLPMVHASGLFFFLSSLLSGTLLVMLDGTDPNVILGGIERHKCTTMIAFPVTVANTVACQKASPRDTSSLRMCCTGGDACHPRIRDDFAQIFHLPLQTLWASTEGCGSLAASGCKTPTYVAMSGVETRLVDSDGEPVKTGDLGQLLIRGPHVALGYWEDSQVTSFPGGWYPTGDTMRKIEGDAYQFVARQKDMIVRGGSNISPLEVEQVLLMHAQVIDAAVVGVPDVELGQRVVGFVQLAPGQGNEILDDVVLFSIERLADYKSPDRLIPVEVIPRNALGKIDRVALANAL